MFKIVKQFDLQILEIISDEMLLQSVNSFERTDGLQTVNIPLKLSTAAVLRFEN